MGWCHSVTLQGTVHIVQYCPTAPDYLVIPVFCSIISLLEEQLQVGYCMQTMHSKVFYFEWKWKNGNVCRQLNVPTEKSENIWYH